MSLNETKGKQSSVPEDSSFTWGEEAYVCGRDSEAEVCSGVPRSSYFLSLTLSFYSTFGLAPRLSYTPLLSYRTCRTAFLLFLIYRFCVVVKLPSQRRWPGLVLLLRSRCLPPPPVSPCAPFFPPFAVSLSRFPATLLPSFPHFCRVSMYLFFFLLGSSSLCVCLLSITSS